ncbi:TIGR02611 family protein [Corynebacterium anserum]|nr:TIGR02611 family protein [Corynebacterium anserum]
MSSLDENGTVLAHGGLRSKISVGCGDCRRVELMSKMGEAVTRKVSKVHMHHRRLKQKKHGWLVRPLTLVGGWLVVIFGLITIPFPGPGWFTVFLGVGILSLELAWPNNVLAFGIRQYDKFEDWWRPQSKAVKGFWIVVMLIVIWIIFIGIFIIMWRTGSLEWTERWLRPLVEKLPDWALRWLGEKQG